jgi:hypothetical protein
MAIRKTSSALVVAPQVDGKSWLGRAAGPRRKIASETLAAFDSSKWLLSHVSIMASVDVEDTVPGEPKKNWKIIPEHAMFVNNNGDAWERKLLARTYGTFLGANNYVEHQQILSLAKGKVIDVALREVPLGRRMDGTPITTLYVDILIATSWEHADLCQKILSGEFNAVSMGCSCKYTICSRCGNVAHDETELCEHVKYYRKQSYYDESGIQRVIAELCGSADDPSSVVFVDASWVRNPAFPGAVLRGILNPPTPPAGLDVSETTFHPVVPSKEMPSLESIFLGKPAVQPVSMPKPAGGYNPAEDSLLSSLKGRVTTGTKHHDLMLKAASGYEGLAAMSREVLAADPAAEGAPTDAPSAEDAAAAETEANKRFSIGDEAADVAAGGGDASGLDGLLGGDTPPDAGAAPVADPPADPSAGGAAPTPPSQEAIDTPIKEITDQLRDTMLNRIKQDLLDGIKDTSGQVDTTYDTGDDSSNLMKYAAEAASIANYKKLLDRKAVDAARISNRKVAAALLVLNTGVPMEKLASFGFKAKDILDVLTHLDGRNTVRIASDVRTYLYARVEGRVFADRSFQWNMRCASSDKERRSLLLRGFIVLANRVPDAQEADQMWSWYRMALALPR